MKKPLFNEKQRKIAAIVMTVLQILIVLIAIVFAAIILANPNVESAEVGGANTKLLPVLTNSMDGDKPDSFKEGDLIIAKTPKDKNALKVGDIVTYKYDIGGEVRLNTHRIVRVEVVDGRTIYTTRGDNNNNDDPWILADEVLAVYQTHLSGVGSAISWLQKPTNFLLVIVLPLIVLFVYNIIMFVRMLLIAKFNKLVTADGEPIDEDEIKRRAIEEYLRQQAEGTKEPQATEAEDTEPPTDEKPKSE